MTKDSYKYSICMGCIHLDLYENDDGKWEVDCKEGEKLLATTDKQSCPNHKKWKTKLPWWYRRLEKYPGVKGFLKAHKDR